MKHTDFTLALIAIILPVVISSGVFARNDSEICTSPACVHAAALLLHNLAPNYKDIDPCEHFDDYVCQGFQDRNQIRSDQSSLDTSSIITAEIETTLRQILESNITSIAQDDRDNFQKLQTDYNACMDLDAIEELGLEPLEERVVDDIKSIYPTAAEASNEKLAPSQNLTDVFILLERLGVGALLGVGVQVSTLHQSLILLDLLSIPPSRSWEIDETTARFQEPGYTDCLCRPSATIRTSKQRGIPKQRNITIISPDVGHSTS